VLIETNSVHKIELLGTEIQTKCGEELEAHIHRLRKPRIIIVDVPEEINASNIKDAIIRQNPNLNLAKGNITAKFTYDSKRKNQNALVEVGADTRKALQSSKMKLRWHVCRTDDYETLTRCFKCLRLTIEQWTVEGR
jgi:hypothetical protein